MCIWLERKIFAGPRVRRIRNGPGADADGDGRSALGISPSYLNLIERNQRPLTVQLLLKLASVYKVDLEELQGETGGGSGAIARGLCRSACWRAELPGDQELIEVAEAAPNAAGGVVKLYRAYREQAARLTDLADLLAGAGAGTEALSGAPPADGRGARRRWSAETANHFAADRRRWRRPFYEALSPGG